MLFNPVHERTVKQSGQAPQYAALEMDFQRAFDGRAAAAKAVAEAERSSDRRVSRRPRTFREREREVRAITNRARVLTREAAHDASYSDVNYVFPTFITTVLPIGLVGLWIVAIITAATDTIAAELNSLATATVIDFYQRLYRPNASDADSLRVSKFATAAWGGFACIVAVYASSLGSLIEVVNRFGSFFYGSILGVFLLATLTRGASGTGAFLGLMAGMAAVAAVAIGRPDISFLWHNVIGATVVFLVGLAYRPPTRATLLTTFVVTASVTTLVGNRRRT